MPGSGHRRALRRSARVRRGACAAARAQALRWRAPAQPRCASHWSSRAVARHASHQFGAHQLAATLAAQAQVAGDALERVGLLAHAVPVCACSPACASAPRQPSASCRHCAMNSRSKSAAHAQCSQLVQHGAVEDAWSADGAAPRTSVIARLTRPLFDAISASVSSKRAVEHRLGQERTRTGAARRPGWTPA